VSFAKGLHRKWLMKLTRSGLGITRPGRAASRETIGRLV